MALGSLVAPSSLIATIHRIEGGAADLVDRPVALRSSRQGLADDAGVPHEQGDTFAPPGTEVAERAVQPGVPVQLGSPTDIANLDAVAVPNGVSNTPRGTLQGVEIDVETQPIHSQAPLPMALS